VAPGRNYGDGLTDHQEPDTSDDEFELRRATHTDDEHIVTMHTRIEAEENDGNESANMLL
jgi:hypothetical protein